MRLYLDDDSVSGLLVRLLRQNGHDAIVPADVALAGALDAAHLAWAVREDRLLVSRNDRDFRALHDLVMVAGGHHPGILVVRFDNDPRKDLQPAGIVRAISNLAAAGVPLSDGFHVLNHWR